MAIWNFDEFRKEKRALQNASPNKINKVLEFSINYWEMKNILLEILTPILLLMVLLSFHFPAIHKLIYLEAYKKISIERTKVLLACFWYFKWNLSMALLYKLLAFRP